ncbi:hypothetical protein ACQJ22_27520, partial [Pseudomonas fragariae (ex Marin et al. 2024)]|uniref:hypothetical protein n=1 Tax=Pseudomonas fragariae (ex Marin et al. 2024) TaxID=3080056 RepID=UPI003D041893
MATIVTRQFSTSQDTNFRVGVGKVDGQMVVLAEQVVAVKAPMVEQPAETAVVHPAQTLDGAATVALVLDGVVMVKTVKLAAAVTMAVVQA